jgi:hypothetical protein
MWKAVDWGLDWVDWKAVLRVVNLVDPMVASMVDN